jgi:hypothetical protein
MDDRNWTSFLGTHMSYLVKRDGTIRLIGGIFRGEELLIDYRVLVSYPCIYQEDDERSGIMIFAEFRPRILTER